MELNPIWVSLTLMGIIGAVVTAVRWFILDKDFSTSSFLITGGWRLVGAFGFVLAILFK